jgi:hypothetical protein
MDILIPAVMLIAMLYLAGTVIQPANIQALPVSGHKTIPVNIYMPPSKCLLTLQTYM